MKIGLIILGILGILFVCAQLVISQNTSNVEHQSYELIKKDSAFEIRFYPEAIAAKVVVEGNMMKVSGRAFGKLAGYIFGSNAEEKTIAMTSPVKMEQLGEKMEMQFIMPSGYQMEDLPEPADSDIVMQKTKPVYTLSLTFGGFAKQEAVDQNIQALLEYAGKKGIKTIGNPWYLGYNPPYQLINRRNEVMIEIEMQTD